MVQQRRKGQEMSGPSNSYQGNQPSYQGNQRDYQGNQHGYQGQPENKLALYQKPEDCEQPFKVG